MERFLENLLTASIHGSIVILAVIALRLVLRKTPKKYICLLWLLAGIRLLMPIEIRSDLSLQPEFTLPIAGLSGLKWAAILPWIWAAVACGFGLYSLVSYLKLKNQVREAVRIRGGWESDRIDTAFILGFIKPRIFIPMGMTKQSRKHILEHERTHLDKGDHWIKMVGFLALSLHWFNPLVWIAYIMLCKDIEMACDERVVQFMELEERKSYSAALLSCSSRQMHFAASPVAFGEVSVKQRILSVLNYKKPSFWISLLGVVAFFFVAVCLVTSPSAAANAPVLESLSPEEQAQLELLQRCHEDMENAFSRDEFFYEIYGLNTKGDVTWNVRLYKQGDNTMWTYTPSSQPDITEGRMECSGKHYAWQNGSWVETDAADERFAGWMNLFRWDTVTAAYVEETQYETSTGLVFTTRWEGTDKTLHTSTVHCSYEADGNLQAIRVDQPNYEKTNTVDIQFDAIKSMLGGTKTVADFFTEAKNAIMEGMVTSEELAVQAEYNAWGVLFRVDDDRLSSMGSDVYIGQDELGWGTVSTTDEYWLEMKVNGKWEVVPAVSTPHWSGDGIGVAKSYYSYSYLDWTPIYGKLEAGEYRMGKNFKCYDRERNYSKEHTFYAEFTIVEAVDAASPEAKAAVERCYSAIEELKTRDYIHFLSSFNWEEETWMNNSNYLEIRTFGEDKEIPENTGRVDIAARWNGLGYCQVREDPEVRNSKVIGVGLFTLDASRANMSSTVSMFSSFFERSNKTAIFPEGVGVVSDEMVRFVLTWPVQGVEFDEASAQLTYKFDANGNLTYMEYIPMWGDTPRTYWVKIYNTTAEEIDAKIKSYTENLFVGSFSWEEAKVKYTDEEFNIRENNFVNNGGSPVNSPVDAAKLALKEYPNLGEYLSLDVSRDESTGMWRVTIRSYVDFDTTYGYRDVYLTDNGATQLLVYEGPVRFDEPRK